MSKKHLFQIINTSIERLDTKGNGIGSYSVENKPHPYKIIVHASAPGDEVSVKLIAGKRSDYIGEIQSVVKPGPARVETKCRHVPYCGGCSLQQIDYQEQSKWKHEYILQLFKEEIEEHKPHVDPLLPCENPWHYRNKMEFSFSQTKEGQRFLGLIMSGSRGRVFNLEECFLCPTWYPSILKATHSFWEESGLSAYHMMKDTGSLRTLTLRQGIKTQDRMVILTVSGNVEYKLKAEHLALFKAKLKQSMDEKEWERTSVFLQIHQIQKGSPSQFYEMLLHGADHIKEKLSIQLNGQEKGFTFKISPTSFFQPNTRQAEKLYQRALEILGPVDKAFDLYCGTGTLSLLLGAISKEVIAVELNPYAVYDAEVNKEYNNISNVRFIKGDVGQVLESLSQDPSFAFPDAAIVDPPRAGLDTKAIAYLVQLKPKKILYISCNPKTQAVNVKELAKAGYKVKCIQPVDQFPHTMHLENIVLLCHED